MFHRHPKFKEQPKMDKFIINLSSKVSTLREEGRPKTKCQSSNAKCQILKAKCKNLNAKI
jgi:hypothetical protein